MKQKETNITPKDNFPLEHVYFYLTKGCNLKCRHCWLAPEYQSSEDYSLPMIDVDLIKSILEQAKSLGLLGVKLTGGEPLLHPQIPEILRIIEEADLSLTIETNGILCTSEIATKIRRSSKRLSVSVSLDGADEHIHEWVRGVSGSFDAAIRGLKNLVEAGVKPQIIMSIMKRNKHQIKPVIQLAEQIGAGSVKFNPIQPTGRGDALHDALETLSIEELIELGEWVENHLSSTSSIPLFYTHPLAFRPMSKMLDRSGEGYGVCGILGILGVLSDGSYSLCGIGETVEELIFGNARTDRLADVWDNTPILNELRSGFPSKLEGVCSECLMKNLCKASCIAQNYYKGKRLWAPYWYCEEARNANLFPATRLRTGI